MRKFTINCEFGANQAPFDLYIGKPKSGNHPLQFQNGWLGKNRGGSVPKSVMKSFEELMYIAEENDVNFEELCAFAVEKYQEKYGKPE